MRNVRWEKILEKKEGRGGHTASIINEIIRHILLRSRIQPETGIDSIHLINRHSPIRRRNEIDVREFMQEPRPRILRERIPQSPELIRCSVYRDAGVLSLWHRRPIEGEPGGTESDDVGAADEDGEDAVASVAAVALGEGLHPGRESDEFRVGVRDGGVRDAGDDGAGDCGEARLREAWEDGGAGGDVLEDFADEWGVTDVFEEGVVGGACEGFSGVGDGGLEVGRQGCESLGYLRCVGAAAFDGVGAAHYDVAGG